MPLSREVARFNRRFTNVVARRLAGRAPGFGIIAHRGRRSGRLYHTPVNVFWRGGRCFVALTYGPTADWVKNVLAAGGCALKTRGKWRRLVAPRVVHDPRRRVVPPPVRFVLRLIGAADFLELRTAPRVGAPPATTTAAGGAPHDAKHADS